MVGVILVVVVLLVVLPSLFLAGGLGFSALIGWLLKEGAERAHPGSELVELNR